MLLLALAACPQTPTGRSYVPPDLQPQAALRLIVMGDSVSAGFGASKLATSYPRLLHRALERRTGRTVERIDVARAGATTAGLLYQRDALKTRLEGPVQGHTLVVMTVGGNDVRKNLDGDLEGELLQDAVARLREVDAFFDDAKRFPDGVSTYLATVYDPTDGAGKTKTCFQKSPAPAGVIVTWRDAYLALGRSAKIAVVDLHGLFAGHGVAASESWFADCVHPNDEGHRKAADLISALMR